MTPDGHCQWPQGCGRPASWCQAHHLIAWIRGGPTDLTNTVLLCWHDHMKVHEGGWQIVKTDDGRLLAIPPPVTLNPLVRGPSLPSAA